MEMLKYESGGLINININALGDILSNKYSISKSRALERVRQIIDIDKVKFEKSKVNGARKKLTKCKK